MDAIRKIEETPMVHTCCGRVVCDGKDCRNNGPWGKVPAWRMGGYYYDFTHTGLAPIDKILSAVGCAGKAYHHTESWGEETEFGYEHLRGKSPEAWIENAAADAAAAIREFLRTLASKEAELSRLREALEWYAAIGTAISPDGLVTITDAGKVARAALTQPTE